MTVESLARVENAWICECVWFDAEGLLHRASFPWELLHNDDSEPPAIVLDEHPVDAPVRGH
jgi:hypothetical protein